MSSLVFPNYLPGIKFTQTKSTMFRTGVQTAVTGKESRISYQAFPLYKWELSYELLRDDQPRTNLVIYSQDATQWTPAASGTGIAPIVFANYTAAPDGTLTADRMIFNKGSGSTTSDYSLIAMPCSATVAGIAHTISFWAKTNDGSTVQARCSGSALGGLFTITPNWQRFSVTWTPQVSQTGPSPLGLYGSLGTPSYADLSVWGGQIEFGIYATTYIATFGQSVVNADLRTMFGLFNQMLGQQDTFLYQDPDFNTVQYQQFGTGNGLTTAFQLTAQYKPGNSYPGPYGLAGMPELIQNTNGSPQIFTGRYGGAELLSNSSRTNLLLQSSLQSGWTTVGVSGSLISGSNPDSSTSVVQITDSSANSAHTLYQGSITISAGQRYTFSVWLKYVNHQYITVGLDNGNTDGVMTTVDLINATFSPINLFATAYGSNADISLITYPNGWIRVSLSGLLPTADTAARCVLGFSDRANAGPNNYRIYTGTGSDKFLCWGAQLEIGSLPTALIPTTTSAVTVGADYSLSTTNLVTFTSAPASTVPLLWSGSFYYRCRFDADSLDFGEFMYRLWDLKKLTLTQVKL
jgi:hypothetical protein